MIEEVATPTFTTILRRLDASYNTTIQMMLSQYKDALGKKELVEVQDWYRDDLFPRRTMSAYPSLTTMGRKIKFHELLCFSYAPMSTMGAVPLPVSGTAVSS